MGPRSMTEGYLFKIANGKILIPASKNVKNGDVIEVMVNRVFVDEVMKKRIEKKALLESIDLYLHRLSRHVLGMRLQILSTSLSCLSCLTSLSIATRSISLMCRMRGLRGFRSPMLY